MNQRFVRLGINIFFITLIYVARSLAADNIDCSSVRLDKDGGPFEHIPVYDQNRNAKDDTNLCYAVTASLLIDANRSLKGETPPFTAPLSISLNYKYNQSTLPIKDQDPTNPSDPSMLAYSLVGGGFIDTAIEGNRGKIICDQRFLQTFDNSISNGTSNNAPLGSPFDSTTENFLKNILDQTEKYRRESQFIDQTSARADHLNDFFKCRSSNENSNIRDILDAAKAANLAASPLQKATVFVKNLCQKNSFILDVPKPQKLDGFPGDFLKEQQALIEKLSDRQLGAEERKKIAQSFYQKFDSKKKIEKLSQQINTLLNLKTPIPVGIGYCHKSLMTTEETNCAPGHASVVIGRRFNQQTQSCEFLVRDSYGANCEDAVGKPRYAWPCENGSVWIESNKLLRSASSISWIPQK